MLDFAGLLRRNIQIAAKETATIDGTRKRSWADMGERVARLAAALRGLGAGDGTRVAMLALNSDRYYEYFFAVPWAGGVFVPINTRLAPPEIEYWLSDSESTVLLVDDAFAEIAPAMREACPALETLIHVGDGPAPEGFLSYETLIAETAPCEAAARGGDDMVGIFYTGGTTGRSKGVMLTHNAMILNALQAAAPLGYRRGAVYLHSAPMFHLANGAGMVNNTLNTGVNVFIPRFEPEAVLHAIARDKVTHALLVPTMINMLINHPATPSTDLSSLERLLYGASVIPEAVLKKAMELMPHVGFGQAYGQTEAAPVLTLLTPDRHVLDGPKAGKLKSAGQPVAGVELRIVDEDDNPVPPGTVGEVTARGPNVMAGYWKLPEVTETTLRGGWLHTGDAGYLDEDGFLFIVDRTKDMIVSGGENVYSAEVEHALYQHAAVAECAVIGVPSEQWGEQVHAIVRLKEGAQADEAELIAHSKGLIANYKCPRSVSFRDEPLPVSGAGKILKRDLRAPFWGDAERQVN